MTWTNMAQPRAFITATNDNGHVWGTWWTRPLGGGLTAFAQQEFHPAGGKVEHRTVFKVWGANATPRTVEAPVDCDGPVTAEMVRALAEQSPPPTDDQWNAAMPEWQVAP